MKPRVLRLQRWWLSFSDPEKPKGQQFLGVAIIDGYNCIDAARRAHARGWNPSGEVLGVTVSKEEFPEERFYATREEALTVGRPVVRTPEGIKGVQ